METTLLERMTILMVKLNVGNTTRWAKELGIPQPTLDKKMRGEQKFNIEILTKVLENYPQVSANWLMLGAGEMFVGESVCSMDELEKAKQTIKEQSDKISELNEEIKRKAKQIDVLLNEKVELYNK